MPTRPTQRLGWEAACSAFPGRGEGLGEGAARVGRRPGDASAAAQLLRPSQLPVHEGSPPPPSCCQPSPTLSCCRPSQAPLSPPLPCLPLLWRPSGPGPATLGLLAGLRPCWLHHLGRCMCNSWPPSLGWGRETSHKDICACLKAGHNSGWVFTLEESCSDNCPPQWEEINSNLPQQVLRRFSLMREGHSQHSFLLVG